MENQQNIESLKILAHAIDLNALGVEEVISWCDKQIAKFDKPDYWLIELSTGRKHPIDIVNKLKMAGAQSEIEDSMYLALVAGAYFRERIEYNRATQLLMDRFCWGEWKVMTDLRQVRSHGIKPSGLFPCCIYGQIRSAYLQHITIRSVHELNPLLLESF